MVKITIINNTTDHIHFRLINTYGIEMGRIYERYSDIPSQFKCNCVLKHLPYIIHPCCTGLDNYYSNICVFRFSGIPLRLEFYHNDGPIMSYTKWILRSKYIFKEHINLSDIHTSNHIRITYTKNLMFVTEITKYMPLYTTIGPLLPDKQAGSIVSHTILDSVQSDMCFKSLPVPCVDSIIEDRDWLDSLKLFFKKLFRIEHEK